MIYINKQIYLHRCSERRNSAAQIGSGEIYICINKYTQADIHECGHTKVYVYYTYIYIHFNDMYIYV